MPANAVESSQCSLSVRYNNECLLSLLLLLLSLSLLSLLPLLLPLLLLLLLLQLLLLLLLCSGPLAQTRGPNLRPRSTWLDV